MFACQARPGGGGASYIGPSYLRLRLALSLNPMAKVPQRQNQINKPASNNRRILITTVFHFVAAVEEHED